MSRIPFDFGPFDSVAALSRGDFLRAAGKTFGVVAAASALGPMLSGQAFAGAAPALATRPIPKSKTGETIPVIGLGTLAMSRKDP